MPRGMLLNDFERSQIFVYKINNKAVREIANILLASPNPVPNIIRMIDINWKRNRAGNPKTLTPRDEKSLLMSTEKAVEVLQRLKIKQDHVSMQTAFNYIAS